MFFDALHELHHHLDELITLACSVGYCTSVPLSNPQVLRATSATSPNLMVAASATRIAIA
jgi:hypothetical protein